MEMVSTAGSRKIFEIFGAFLLVHPVLSTGFLRSRRVNPLRNIAPATNGFAAGFLIVIE